MYLTSLKLKNFRNHADSHFELNRRTNVLAGDNGQGKTNVLEGIAYLCFTKSFYAASDSTTVNIGSSMFEVEGNFVSDQDKESYLRIAYSAEKREKVYHINKRRIEPLMSVIGKFPVVICSPEHAPITSGGPVERRRFVDLAISQSDEVYFRNLLEYRHILKQRNKVLFEGKQARESIIGLLEPWDEQLVSHAALITRRRKVFLEEFRSYITSAYSHVAGDGEVPLLHYAPTVGLEETDSDGDLERKLSEALKESHPREKAVGSTLIGPHRDEILMTINGLDLRKYASQGQHKTFLVALKIGEFFYLKDRCRETPILLLDDVFGELDMKRSGRLFGFVGSLSQTVITTTSPGIFQADASGDVKVFYISNGTVK